MPIDIPPPPPASISSLSAALSRIAAAHSLAAQAPSLARSANRAVRERGTADVSTPVLSSPVYVLGLDAIVAGRDLAGAKLGLWTHFLPSAQGADDVVSADVSADTSRFASLNEGPQVLGFFRQVRTLQQAADLGPQSFGLAQLRVPALHVEAVWLRDRAGTGGIVIPVAPTSPALSAGRRYSVAEFLAALRPAAEAALANTDPRKGG
jgi:hypothetical protein